MRVLFLSETQGWSGGAAQLLALALGLRGKGAEISLASPADGEAARRARDAGLRHIPMHPRQDYDLPTALRLRRMLIDEKIDVLHAHHPRAHAVGLLAMHCMGRRRPVYVVSRRVSFSVKSNPFSAFKYRSPRIDGYAAVAENVRRQLIEAGVPPQRVRTIPSGVDTVRFSPADRDEALSRELNLPDPGAQGRGIAVIGKVANYSPWKGQSVFFEAAARLLKTGREAVFLVAGRDTDGPECRRAAQEAGLKEKDVRFLGFRSDVPRVLSLLDVSVNAAVQGEGISGALRESLAMSVPVVASDAGGNAELVREGKTGRLFCCGSSEELARVLGETLADPAAARALAHAGRELVLREFSVEALVERTEAYYRELLARRA
ncbi:MAG: glycosyltransferase [Elusimicrobiota bacterium]|jgi:glycosyltransferase involved in cell wall biosynthesis